MHSPSSNFFWISSPCRNYKEKKPNNERQHLQTGMQYKSFKQKRQNRSLLLLLLESVGRLAAIASHGALSMENQLQRNGSSLQYQSVKCLFKLKSYWWLCLSALFWTKTSFCICRAMQSTHMKYELFTKIRDAELRLWAPGMHVKAFLSKGGLDI